MLKPKVVKSKKTTEEGTTVKKKKPNVKEIDGVTWLLDEAGNPLKKVRKKGTVPEKKPVPSRGRSPVVPNGTTTAAAATAAAAAAGVKAKAKKAVVEIDGQLYLLDENGKPSKKIRRKGDKAVRSASQGPIGISARGRIDRQSLNDRRRARSLNRLKPGDAEGTPTALDKNGKRLRPKRASVDTISALTPGISIPSDDDLGLLGDNMFDQLWGDGDRKTSTAIKKSGKATQKGSSPTEAESGTTETISLSEKISSLGKENRELSLKLQAAEERAHEVSEQNKREKAKNVKAMTDMMQLKADYTESSSEVQKLKSKIKDLTSSLETKEEEIFKLRETIESEAAQAASEQGSSRELNGREIPGSGGRDSIRTLGSGKEVDELFAENRTLQRKMEFERSNAQQNMKKQEDKMAFMTKEVASLREELEMILRGEVGNIVVNPTFVRLLDEKKRLTSELEQEKEVYEIRLKSMEEEMSSLERLNRDFKKQLRENGITPTEGDAHQITGLRKSDSVYERRGSVANNKHIGEINVNFNKSMSDGKAWFPFGNK